MAGTSRGEIAALGPTYELDAVLTTATDALILQALSSVGSPQERQEPIAA
jgi:hypothetical protein